MVPSAQGWVTAKAGKGGVQGFGLTVTVSTQCVEVRGARSLHGNAVTVVRRASGPDRLSLRRPLQDNSGVVCSLGLHADPVKAGVTDGQVSRKRPSSRRADGQSGNRVPAAV